MQADHLIALETEDVDLLLVTATDLETECLHEFLNERQTLKKVHHDILTFFLGTLGTYSIAHVQCTMGSMSTNGSTLTVNNSIIRWRPRAVVMVGIAFGKDEKMQKIGDVLVSTGVVGYESQRIGKDANQQRGETRKSGVTLSNRFSNAKTWEHLSSLGIAKIFSGLLLSGEKLIDNQVFRDELLNLYPEAVGGEMEGIGLAAAADSLKTEWILIKGICDWADGNKGENKRERQISAAKAAISLCAHVIEHKDSLKGLQGNRSYPHNPAMADTSLAIVDIAKTTSSIEEALFAVYRPKVDEFYLERELDSIIRDSAQLHHIWIWGAIGVGKTSALLKYAYNESKNVIFADLSTASGGKVETLLEELYWILVEKLQVKLSKNSKKDSQSLCRSISKIIVDNVKKDTVIIIDEFSSDSFSDLEKFIKLIGNIVLGVTNNIHLPKVKVVFGSLVSPYQNQGNILKFSERVRVIEAKSWSDQECIDWLRLIKNHIPWVEEEGVIEKLIKASQNCPRKLKMICRLHTTNVRRGPCSIENTLDAYREEIYT